jgi:hypothetical protein
MGELAGIFVSTFPKVETKNAGRKMDALATIGANGGRLAFVRLVVGDLETWR